MPFIKRFIEDQIYHESLLSVLKYLDKNDLYSECQTRGTARTIIKRQRPHNLNTESQRWRFYNKIQPYLENICCGNGECGTRIGISNIENAFNNEDQIGSLLCPDCLINKGSELWYGGD